MPDHVTYACLRPSWLSRGLVVLVATVGAASVAAATIGQVGDAATVSTPAERITAVGEGLLFPMSPTPKCEVFNNFGGFSGVFGSGGHQGVDIGGDLGQEVYAVEAGVLYRKFTDLGSAAGYGWGLDADGGTQYRYYHLSAFVEQLEVGDRVQRGQLIGYVGDTGNATPGGHHLHFEVRPGPGHDQPVDPVPLLAIPRTCEVYPKQ